MLTRPLSVCLLIGLASAPWTADATPRGPRGAPTSTWSPAVTNRTIRPSTPVGRPAPVPARQPAVARAARPGVRKTPVPPPPKTPVARAVRKPVQGSLQLHPPATGAVVRSSPVRGTLAPIHVLVAKPMVSPPLPRPEPSVSSDFKFGPKGISRQINQDWSMSFSAALSPAPSASTQNHPVSQWDRVMPVIKLEKTF